MGKNTFDIIEFNKILGEIKLAMINSPTKGLSVFYSMWVYKNDRTVLESLIEGLKLRLGNAEKKELVKKFIKNFESVREHALKHEARVIIEAIQESLIHEISNDYNASQMYDSYL